MTEEFDDFEERLRAALRAEADSIPISHDALERIRARTERRRLFPWSGLVWFRPVVAVCAAVLIAGSVLLGTPQIRDHVLPGSFVSASDSRQAEDPPPSLGQEPHDGDGAVAPPAGGVPFQPVPPHSEASPSVPEATSSPEESQQPSCTATPRSRDDDAHRAESSRSDDTRPCPSGSPAAEEGEETPSSPPSADDEQDGVSSSPRPSDPGETPSSSPTLSGDGSTR
ncbi:prolipoprotein diacylglyceryl transferase [Thermobifida cellulosilytica]|uniref:Uncharacterized protein n=1 Tax=Thermobifida cellulosilytica TB100 TaxID=665004 RepID=A0A147KD72_THECS|nr:hypothetical protein [Thermobifida cellulosilytica]KUP95207.1 hypothetical protein AC529_18680 [Thermobifida cellulosilytica TB100]